MKGFIVLALGALFLYNNSLEAQRYNRRKQESDFGFGVKAGLNYSNQSTTINSSDLKIQSIVRYNAGVYVNYYIADFLVVQPEFMVSGKGVHLSDAYDDFEDILTYLDIPVIVKYQPVSLLNIQAGPEFGYRIGATQKLIDSGEKNDVSEYYKKYDFGIALGVEANLPFKLDITIRYVLGLSPVTYGTQANEPWKNNFIQFSLGYRITGR